MSHIPEAVIAGLKQSVPILALVERRGVVLAGCGLGQWRGLCCFHAEETPSLQVSERENAFHCFGCGVKGDVIAWVRQAEGLSFPGAVAWLQAFERGETPAADAAATAPGAGLAARQRFACPLSADAEGAVLLGEVAAFYARTLIDDRLATAGEARDYLTRRKLWDVGVLTRLGIGFDDRTLGPRLPAKQVKAGERLRRALAAAGLYRDSGHAHFVGCVTVPLFAGDAEMTLEPAAAPTAPVSMYGRRVQVGKSGIRHVNLPGPRRGVFNAQGARTAAAAHDGTLILCEAALDALTLIVHGQPHATACLGVNGYTDDVRQFVRTHARRVLIAFDRDEAGERGAGPVADDLIAAGLAVYRVQLPSGQDVNAVACAADDPAAVLADFLRTAVWIGGTPRVTVPAAPAAMDSETTIKTGLNVVADANAETEAEVAAVEETASAALRAQTAATSSAPADFFSTADVHAAPPAAALCESAAPSAAPAALAAPPPFIGMVRADGPDAVVMVVGTREWRARGWRANTAYDRLRVAVRVREHGRVCGDTVDLASMKTRQAFISAVAAELSAPVPALRDEVGALWLALEQAQDQLIRATQEPQPKPDHVGTMSAARRHAALTLLRSPTLLNDVRAGVAACGLVGESDNAVVAYLAAISRKLADPLAILVQATSAGGKTSIVDTVLSLVPPEDRIEVSALSSRALFYVEPDALAHKALSIAEQEGAASAAYSLKLMQSAGRLSIAIPVQNPDTGEMETKTRTVDGPVALFLTTTAAELDDELQNRFLVLSTDDSAGQTALVQAHQRRRETWAGYVSAVAAAAVRTLHHDAQRLLEPVRVFNPFAEQLTFPSHCPRMRRDHAKYLRLIRALTFLRQYQRPRRTSTLADGDGSVVYVETTVDDIRDANRLIGAVLGRSLDELAPQTRRLLRLLRDLTLARVRSRGGALADAQGHASAGAPARARVRFTRREVREFCGWSYDQVRVHLDRLLALEYVVAHRSGQGALGEFSLLWSGDGEDGASVLPGLSEPRALGEPRASGDTTADTTADAADFGGPLVPGWGGLGGDASAVTAMGASPDHGNENISKSSVESMATRLPSAVHLARVRVIARSTPHPAPEPVPAAVVVVVATATEAERSDAASASAHAHAPTSACAVT